MPPLADCQNQTGLKAKLNRTLECKKLQGCLHTQLNWSNRWSNKQNACLKFGNAYLSIAYLPTALHDFTASKPSKQHNHTSCSTLLSDIQGTRSRASTNCSDVHDSSGYKCFRWGSHHQVVSPLSSRVTSKANSAELWCCLSTLRPKWGDVKHQREISKSTLVSIIDIFKQGMPSKIILHNFLFVSNHHELLLTHYAVRRMQRATTSSLHHHLQVCSYF